ncbi:MAG TPA: serine/threonine-protein kinase [Candidatus Saccharimonadales bacterium]|nr:serine/threonine-protein kinase [Candidatus Saccharimonadales bacterium]
MSSTHSICPVCGATVRQSASEGLCPRCLLRAAVQPAGPTPEGDAAEGAGASPTAGAPPLRLGDYDLLAKLAEGGMGVVYKARQRSLNRLVALKLILAGRLATADELRRFQTEAEAAARLDHPNIVPIYEVGLAEGRHFFAMKLIDGGPLSRPTDRRRPEGSSARLLEQIARAVHHAHERGILHRDLKPANILIDAQGEPHVTDFGLARLAGSDSSVTLPGTIVGTPSFMAPEQAAAGAAELTTAADVYSLGAVLYFLITGQPPFTGRSATETIQRVLHEDPPRPATVAPGSDLELEIICLKCLEKDPAQRYRSALELAEDLARWQRHEPILARPARWWERTRKWVRRRPAWAALIAVSAFSAITFVALLAGTHTRLQREKNRALQEEETTRQSLYAADVYLADQALAAGNLGRARQALENHRPTPGHSDLRGFEWHYLWNQCQGDQLAILNGHEAGVTCLAFSPDGRWLASGSEDRTVRIWDVAASALKRVWPPFAEPVRAVGFSPDGRQLWVGTADAVISTWDVESGTRTASCQEEGGDMVLSRTAPRAAFSWVLFPNTGREAIVTVFDLSTGARLSTLRDAGGVVGFSHDQRTVATSARGGFKLWNAQGWCELRHVPSREDFSAFLFSPEDRQLAAFSEREDHVVVWDLASERVLQELSAPGARLRMGDFSPDGRALVTCGPEQSLRLWDLTGRRPPAELRGHVKEVQAVQFSPNGHLIASASKDGTVRLWPAVAPTPVAWPTNVFPPCALSSDGRQLVSQSALGRRDAHVLLWDLQSRQGVQLRGLAGAQPLALLENDRVLLHMTRPTLGKDLWLGRFGLANQETTASHRLEESDRPRTATDFAPASGLFALGSYDGRILIWNSVEGQPVAALAGPSNEVQVLRFSADGRALASFTKGSGVTLWQLPSGVVLKRWPVAIARVEDLAFSPDGALLAAAESNNAIEIWAVSTGQVRATLTGHAGAVLRLAFSPDGRTLASTSRDETVRLWSLAARRELATLSQDGALDYLEFTRDGRSLVGTGTNGHLRVWRALQLSQMPAPTSARVD